MHVWAVVMDALLADVNRLAPIQERPTPERASWPRCGSLRAAARAFGPAPAVASWRRPETSGSTVVACQSTPSSPIHAGPWLAPGPRAAARPQGLVYLWM